MSFYTVRQIKKTRRDYHCQWRWEKIETGIEEYEEPEEALQP